MKLNTVEKREYTLLNNGRCPVCGEQVRDTFKHKKLYRIRLYIEEKDKRAFKCRSCKNKINF